MAVGPVRDAMIRLAFVGALMGVGCAASSPTPPPLSAPGPTVVEPQVRPWAPRPDRQCTPQAEGDEAACAARGKDYSFGPLIYGGGPQRSEAQLEAERRVFEGTSLPCRCMSLAERE